MWNNLIGRRLTIVTYHRLSEVSPEGIKYSLPYLFVKKKTFENHILFFKKHYRIITFKDLNEFNKKGKIPWNALIITFDDGYEDNLKLAMPTIKQHQIPCSVFLATDKIGGNDVAWWDEIYWRMNLLTKHKGRNVGKDCNHDVLMAEMLNKLRIDPSGIFSEMNGWEENEITELLRLLRNAVRIQEREIISYNKFLTWDQVVMMMEWIDFESHGRSHKILTNLDDEKVKKEMEESKMTIENRIKRKVIAFSFPAGKYDGRMEGILKDCGYQFAVTQRRGINDCKEPFELKRINIWEGTSSNPILKKYSKPILAMSLSRLS